MRGVTIANKYPWNEIDKNALPERYRRLGTDLAVAREVRKPKLWLLSFIEADPELKAACDEAKGYYKDGGNPPSALISNLDLKPIIQGAGPRTAPRVEDIRREAAERYRAKAYRAAQKKDQHIRFPHGPVALFFVGDQHIGNAGTDVERMFHEQEVIMKTPGAYVVQMGDVSDNFIVGKLMSENMKPALPVWEQWELASAYLHAWESRIVAFCGGNHGAWTLKVSGIDYQRDICPDGILYDGDELRFNVHLGDEATLRVMARHKWKGASMYNVTQGIERSAKLENPNFDIYAGAHIHQGAVAREFIHNRERKMALLSGAYKIEDDYAIEQGFGPNDASTATCVVLHDDGSFFGCSDLYAVSHYMHCTYSN